MGFSGRTDAHSVTPTPIPTFPLKGKERNSAAFRLLMVLSAPLRRSPNKPPGFARGNLTRYPVKTDVEFASAKLSSDCFGAINMISWHT